MIDGIALALIKTYQRSWLFRSSFLKSLGACRFRPTCSVYTYQAIKRYGIITGSLLGLKRIARCHPWNQGGWDPVKQKTKN